MSNQVRALVALGERVVSAEKSLREEGLYWAQSKLERVERYLTEGESLNSLGELQGAGPALDVAVSRLEEAVAAFKIAWHYLDSSTSDVSESDYVAWLEQLIAKSPRLTTEVARMNEQATR